MASSGVIVVCTGGVGAAGEERWPRLDRRGWGGPSSLRDHHPKEWHTPPCRLPRWETGLGVEAVARFAVERVRSRMEGEGVGPDEQQVSTDTGTAGSM